jgi:hypothetical protein
MIDLPRNILGVAVLNIRVRPFASGRAITNMPLFASGTYLQPSTSFRRFL